MPRMKDRKEFCTEKIIVRRIEVLDVNNNRRDRTVRSQWSGRISQTTRGIWLNWGKRGERIDANISPTATVNPERVAFREANPKVFSYHRKNLSYESLLWFCDRVQLNALVCCSERRCKVVAD